MDKIEQNDNFFDNLIDSIYNFNWLLLLSVAIAYLYIVSTTFDDLLRKQNSSNFDITGELNSVGHLVKLCYMLILTIFVYIFMNAAKN